MGKRRLIWHANSGRIRFIGTINNNTEEVQMVACMLNCGIDVPSLKKAGNTHTASALHLAARNGHSHVFHIWC